MTSRRGVLGRAWPAGWSRWAAVAVVVGALAVPVVIGVEAAAEPGRCPPVRGETEALFADDRGCRLPLRPGDEHFGADHIRRRDREAGHHPLDRPALERVRRGVARPGYRIEGAFSAHAEPGPAGPSGRPLTQCTFVDRADWRGLGPKGVITSYLKDGRLTSSGCARERPASAQRHAERWGSAGDVQNRPAAQAVPPTVR